MFLHDCCPSLLFIHPQVFPCVPLAHLNQPHPMSLIYFRSFSHDPSASMQLCKSSQPSSVRSSTMTYPNIESEKPSLWKVRSPNITSSLHYSLYRDTCLERRQLKRDQRTVLVCSSLIASPPCSVPSQDWCRILPIVSTFWDLECEWQKTILLRMIL